MEPYLTCPIRFHGDVFSYTQCARYVVLTSNSGPNDTNVVQFSSLFEWTGQVGCYVSAMFCALTEHHYMVRKAKLQRQ